VRKEGRQRSGFPFTYTVTVRFVLAAVMAVLLGVVTTTDRVACLDGCTDDTQHSSPSTATPSVCGLCHGWSGPFAIDVGAPAARPALMLPAITPQELPAHLAPLDHPPELA
jgi:hypothetical protein